MGKMCFSPAQQEIIDVMACLNEKEDLTDLKYTLVKFLNDRLQRKLNGLWETGAISQQKLDEWGASHLRTPYKQ